MTSEEAIKFMEIYSNLPVKTRREIVVVVDGEPFSWDVARREIEGNTELGKRILKKLKELKII
jgi:hypothetical protein